MYPFMSQYDVLDAEVRFVTDEYMIREGSGSLSVCVESGVMGGFETALTVSLTAQDETAGETRASLNNSIVFHCVYSGV